MALLEHYDGCPLCGAQSRLLGTADCTRYVSWHEPLPRVLEWMKCNDCGHVHTRHFWTPTGLDEVFRSVHGTQIVNISDNFDAKRTMWGPVVDRTLDLLGGYRVMMNSAEPWTWVDVGCGDGGLLMAAGDFGFSAIGVDARPETVNQLNNLGFNVINGTFAEVSFQRRLDVLSMMDILEHLPFPKQALMKAAQIIRPGGVIVLSLPDRTCSSWRLMDSVKANPYWIEIEHHHNFSRTQLLQLLQQSGFEPAGFAIPLRYKAQMEVYAVRTAASSDAPESL